MTLLEIKKNLNTYDRDIISWLTNTSKHSNLIKIYIAYKRAKGDYSDDVAIANEFGLRLKK